MKNKYSLAQLAAIYCTYKDLDVKTRTVKCCTCGKTIQINSFEDCFNVYGHFIDRSLEPKLKYHPLNAHSQCVSCNIYANPLEMQHKYYNYMIYRYGNSIKEDLLNAEEKTEEQYKEFYVIELIKLSIKFPELTDIVVDKSSGELLYPVDTSIENDIEKQFNTYSPNFKFDLDNLCRVLNSEYIEYQRL